MFFIFNGFCVSKHPCQHLCFGDDPNKMLLMKLVISCIQFQIINGKSYYLLCLMTLFFFQGWWDSAIEAPGRDRDSHDHMCHHFPGPDASGHWVLLLLPQEEKHQGCEKEAGVQHRVRGHQEVRASVHVRGAQDTQVCPPTQFFLFAFL